VSARDPGYDPRRQHPRSGARPASVVAAGPARPAWLLPAAVAIALVLGIGIGFGSGVLGGASGGSSRATPPVPGVVGAETGTPDPGSSVVAVVPSDGAPTGDPADDPGAEPSPSSVAVAADPVLADVAIVPVTQFRTGRADVRSAEVNGIATGSSPYSALVLVARDADAILASLGVKRSVLGSHLVTFATAKALSADLAKHRTRLGFLRADEVTPSVRALAWGPNALFGVGRVGSLARWPLTARLEVPDGSTPAYDPDKAWTLVAGGDIMLDRGVSLAIGGAKAGAKFPFAGGTVAITGRCKDCSPFGWDLPYTKRTGNAGDVRALTRGADIAIANFENPAPDNWRWHGKGMVFSANPKHIAGLKDAGFDWVSLANNHIGDAGRAGIVSTQGNLDDYGIKHAGAGKNTADAHKASLLKVGGVTVGILGYDTIAAYYASGTSTPGSARMNKSFLTKDIAAARKAGADVVIVFPHWGVEYRAKPTDSQRSLAHLAIDAGADLVIGNHPHWAEGMEIYKGKPIWYALGNLVFDQTWSEPTMEGITLEMTFRGKQLVQVRIRPHLILGKAQPNFMDPMGSGKVVMDQVWGASKGLLAW
jgi:poly-gamma-glutamate capsule biosynthesis protein CapA/YwtB (metallophosphatase superfamily)